MSKSIKWIAVLGLITLAAACAREQEEEFIIVEPEPMSEEPVFTGKF